MEFIPFLLKFANIFCQCLWVSSGYKGLKKKRNQVYQHSALFQADLHMISELFLIILFSNASSHMIEGCMGWKKTL